MDIERFQKALEGRASLAQIGPDELRVLLSYCEARTYFPGQALWTAGELREYAFLLVTGRVEQKASSYDGRWTERFSEPGTILGISALVEGWPYHSSAFAIERAEVLLFSRANFNAIFDAREPVAFCLIDAIGEHLIQDMRGANRRLQEVFGNPADTLRSLRRRVRDD